MQSSDSFERILQGRYVPPMRSNLPERIIEASLRVTPAKAKAAVSWLADLCDCFILPRPALAMGLALFIGIVIGVTPDTGTASADDDIYQSPVQADLGDML